MVSSIDKLDASHSSLRLLVAKSLKESTENELFDFAKDSDLILRTCAAREIQIRGTPKGFDFALQLCKSKRFEDREMAAFLLGQLSPPNYKYFAKSILPLRKLLSDQYYEVRAAAIGAFGFLAPANKKSHKQIFKSVAKFSSDENEIVRNAVACTLGLVYLEEARKLVEKLSDDPCVEVRNSAAFGLEMHHVFTEVQSKSLFSLRKPRM